MPVGAEERAEGYDARLEKDGARPVKYVLTPTRAEIKCGYESLVEVLTRRADEHRAHGREDRAERITGHAQKLRGRIELIEWDWTDFDEEDQAAGKEPY